ncbi:MAG: hypothetical protein IRZ03_05180 [Acidobacterium ailaaui]|nr:hypothetical protein [Pseudacidobacterium ailaaui]MCL6463583.1 hypothetical protein [Pseudacidobacterium ailaaui]
MTKAAPDPRLFTELWVSFAALIRSYVAAHDLGRPTGHASIDDGAEGRLSIRAEKKVLAIDFDGSSGKGEWTLYENVPCPERVLATGRFEFSADSTVKFSDRRGSVELEIAAEAFTARVFDEN